MKPVPKISSNDPLKVEDLPEEYVESKTEKKGKITFWLGSLFFVGIVITTFMVYFYWGKLG